MALFQYNSQQWFNTDCIERIDDCGWDVSVTLKSGKECRVSGSDRAAFFDKIREAEKLSSMVKVLPDVTMSDTDILRSMLEVSSTHTFVDPRFAEAVKRYPEEANRHDGVIPLD